MIAVVRVCRYNETVQQNASYLKKAALPYFVFLNNNNLSIY